MITGKLQPFPESFCSFHFWDQNLSDSLVSSPKTWYIIVTRDVGIFIFGRVLSLAKQRIGFFCGSFDPFLRAHLSAIHRAMEAERLDQVLVVMSAFPGEAACVAGSEDRWDACDRLQR